SEANIEVETEDGSNHTIEVKPIANGFVTGANAYTFEDGVGVISDFLVNSSTVDQIQSYEAYAVDSNMVCSGPKTIIDVLVISQYLENVVTTLCNCSNGCVSVGLETELDYSYQWNTGETESIIVVCPEEPTSYFITVTDTEGCEKYESFFVDCDGLSDECIEPVEYKLVYDFFLDSNGDGVKDANENSYAGGSFFLNSFQEIIYNIDIGEDTLYLEEGTYTLTYNGENLDDFDLSTESTITIDLNEGNDCVKVEFGLVSNNENRNLTLYHSLIRQCNSERTFYTFLKNKGSMVENGILWVTLDEIVLPDDFPAQASIDTFIAPNQVGWYFEDLLPGEKLERSVNVYIPGPPDFSPGWVMNFKLNSELENADGSVQFYGEKELALSILCGYDPNDKAVEPSHEEGYTNIDEDKLIYKIRFQNTGNAPTEDIEILDTLSEFLDVSTVQYIAGSHDEFLTLSRISDRILSFKFDNIFLPDSTADLEGSQGFLIYEVDILGGVEEGTLIENTAHIYFDRNPAIVTNTTKNVLYPDLDMDGYYSIEDCDEENAAINPGAEEVPNNDIDEDCDGIALIIDNDMDGFNSDEDCDDENAEINPDAEEIPNNDVDENCDNLIIVIDNDMDGFNSDEDCDDENAEINPDAEEIVNNEVDEDCDGVALVIDNDMDGFNSDEDCDDENAEINPDAEEIANNAVDEDCDGVALVIDNDMDGFNSDEDCDDENAEINPDAEEI
ncbi:MAG: MopE-related protein, partial [Saprospiraceae bacterium]|nr:MopE-related protein [Saprospiraceae bacterium]